MRLALALLVVGGAGNAGRVLAADLRLDEALARAHAASPVLRAAEADLAAAQARLRQARLIPANPTLSGDVARHALGPDVENDRGIEVGQEVEIGQRGLRIRAAEHDVAHAMQALADRRRTVDGEVRRAFWGLAAAERRRALAEERLALARRVAEATRRRLRSGEVGTLDARLAELEATRAETERTAAETARAEAVARLGVALGAPADESLTVAPGEERPLVREPEAALVARALAERPDLAAAREEAARLEAEAAVVRRRGWIPNPTFRGFYRHESGNERILGGGISVPLPVFNREQGTEAELLAQASGAKTEVARLRDAIPREVHVAVVRRDAADAAWRRYETEALPAAREAQAALARAFDAGSLGLPELLVQQDRLLQVRGAAIDAWLERHEADAQVLEAVGGEAP
ncbi:MAG TPA: TolC family protein [Candidatus Binatia bacterium]|nr:TolC family protein [Candidatus Binatia bacterium]